MKLQKMHRFVLFSLVILIVGTFSPAVAHVNYRDVSDHTVVFIPGTTSVSPEMETALARRSTRRWNRFRQCSIGR